MSFAAGFYGTLARGMESKRDFIRSRVEEDRKYLRQQGLRRMDEVNQQRQAYETAAQSLLRRGASESLVLGQLEQDPQGLMEVYREVNSANVTNAEAINNVFQLNEEYSGSTLQDILSAVIPTASNIPSDASPTDTRNRTLAAWLGLDIEEALNDQVYQAEIVGGMTGDDILGATSVQARGSGTTTLNLEALETGRSGGVSNADARITHNKIRLDYLDQLNAELERVNTQFEMTEPGEDQERLFRERKKLETILEESDSSTQLSLMFDHFGVSPLAKQVYSETPEVFSNFFPPSILSMFETQEEETEEVGESVSTSEVPSLSETETAIEEAFETFFKENPDADYGTVVVDGVEYTAPNLDKAPEPEEEEIVFNSRRALDQDILQDRPDIPKSSFGADGLPLESAEIVEPVEEGAEESAKVYQTLTQEEWDTLLVSLIESDYSEEDALALMENAGYKLETENK